MATTLIHAASTQEKLLRARAASVKLALLSTEEKNALLLAIANARTWKLRALKGRCATVCC
jgi:gamma-glutamyl phosphate reductase